MSTDPEPLAVGGSHPVRRGALAGAIAALVALAGMYLLSLLGGLRALPDLLQEPILALMPGPVFGFLIDNLQHLGKVLEEASIVLGLVACGAGLGMVYGALVRRRVRAPALIVVGAAWLFAMLVVFPLLRDGVFALNEGLLGPAAWALLFIVFATVLQLGFAPLGNPVDPGRRHALGLVPAGLGLASLGVIGFRLVPGWYSAVAQPPEAGVSGASPEITPIENFYVVSKNFSDPVVAAAGWKLNVSGLVDRPLTLTLDDLRARPSTQQYVTFACISNDVGGNLISTGLFTGCVLRDLLNDAGPKQGAATVAYRAADGFTESYPLSLVMSAPEILVAYDLDGKPLPDRHGFPARIVMPGHYGMKQPKWLTSIELRSDNPGGFWEEQGWDRVATVKTSSRIDYPTAALLLRRGQVHVSGVAFAGTRGISAVQVSFDSGRSWKDAYLKPPLSKFSWTLWSLPWEPPHEGVYTLVVRARDGNGQLQDERVSPSFPSGATGYHRVLVTVGG